jgi:arylsulfatase A-like enzyme
MLPAALAVLLVGLGCSRAETPRHLVLVTLDTLRADRLSAYGHDRLTSPHLDALAARGIRFEDAISQATLTTASHASLLTGLNPPAHGPEHLSGQNLAEENLTLAEVLKQAGFTTAAFVSALPLRRGRGFEQGFDVYDDHRGKKGLERNAASTNASVARWLEDPPQGRVFLWVHYFDAHLPYRAPRAVRERFAARPAQPSLRRFINVNDKGRRRPSPALVRHMKDLYDAEIAFVDSALGRLEEMLEQAGLLEDALVVVLADHGESLGEHGLYFVHFDVYPESARVPLILARI